jgi:hypothetical protein
MLIPQVYRLVPGLAIVKAPLVGHTRGHKELQRTVDSGMSDPWIGTLHHLEQIVHRDMVAAQEEGEDQFTLASLLETVFAHMSSQALTKYSCTLRHPTPPSAL